ncbi:hypothetical protein, partial [Streptomyces bugieae]|nr:hypothetical protein [Streptomyces sp. DSM 41528]
GAGIAKGEQRSHPQIPNSVPDTLDQRTAFHAEAVLTLVSQVCRVVNVPPMSNQHQTLADVLASDPDKSE